jgi:hypothetical protein
MPYAPSTQPETPRQILARSARVYRSSFFKVILVALLLAATTFMSPLIAVIGGHDLATTVPDSALKRLSPLLFEIIGITLFTIMLWRIRCVMDNFKESLKNDLMITLKKIPRIVGAALVETGISISLIFMSLGLFYFLRDQHLLLTMDKLQMTLVVSLLSIQFVMDIFIFILLMFYLPLILTENKHIFEALGKSAGLVWGHWWRTFSIQIVPWCFYLLTLYILKSLFHMNLFHTSGFTLAEVSTDIIILAFFIPWFAATLLVQLNDLELRKKQETLIE